MYECICSYAFTNVHASAQVLERNIGKQQPCVFTTLSYITTILSPPYWIWVTVLEASLFLVIISSSLLTCFLCLCTIFIFKVYCFYIKQGKGCCVVNAVFSKKKKKERNISSGDEFSMFYVPQTDARTSADYRM